MERKRKTNHSIWGYKRVSLEKDKWTNKLSYFGSQNGRLEGSFRWDISLLHILSNLRKLSSSTCCLTKIRELYYPKCIKYNLADD